jgi:hypothetical protein
MSILSFFFALELMCDASVVSSFFLASLLVLRNKTAAALIAAGVLCLMSK